MERSSVDDLERDGVGDGCCRFAILGGVGVTVTPFLDDKAWKFEATVVVMHGWEGVTNSLSAVCLQPAAFLIRQLLPLVLSTLQKSPSPLQ